MTTYSIQNGRQKVLVAVPTVLTFLALLLTGIRLYARRIQRMRALLDDYLCVLACVRSQRLGLNLISTLLLTRTF